MTDRKLLSYAKEAQAKAYAPYSGFAVGAAIESTDGRIFTGCNVENSSFGCTICAEQAAVTRAVGEGCREFARIAVVADSEDYCLPCGTCRQILSEFSPEVEVLCAKAGGAYVSYRLRDLMPLAFRLGE